MSFRGHAFVSSTLLGTLVATAPVYAQAPTGTVTGRIVNATTQTPVVGARVTVVGSTQQTVSRDDGRFTLAGVPAGAQRVRVALIGFAPRSSRWP